MDKNGFEITTLDGKTSTTTITILEDEWGDAELGDYPHFMLKEIHEQPEALRQCISGRCQPRKIKYPIRRYRTFTFSIEKHPSCSPHWLWHIAPCL